MTEYKFKTKEFGISEEGIHLLRNGFNHKTYKYPEITSVEIGRGKEIKNWVLLLIFGAVLASLGLWFGEMLFTGLGHGVSTSLGGHKGAKAIAIAIMFPLALIAFGSYSIYSATRSGTVLTLRCANNQREVFLLRNLESDGQLHRVKAFLEEKTNLIE